MNLAIAPGNIFVGRRRLVMLAGEPGIGKTRTAQELATYAGPRQCQVVWGRCYEGQGARAYWPWVQAIRSYVRDQSAGQLRSEMGAGAPDIAKVVSDMRERNAARATIHWRFNTQDATAKLHRL